MTRVGLALVLAFVVALALVPGAAWARHTFHGGIRAGVHSRHVRVFTGHRHPFGHHKFKQHGPFRHHKIHRRSLGHLIPRTHTHFRHRGFHHHHLRPHAIVVHPVPKAVWVAGFWHWNGFQWVWVAGHWALPGHGLLLRNPCD